jgi:hypothetical protein
MVKASIGKNRGLTDETLKQIDELVLSIPRIEPGYLSAFDKSLSIPYPLISPVLTMVRYIPYDRSSNPVILSFQMAMLSFNEDKSGRYGMNSEMTLELVKPKDSLLACVTYILLVGPPVEVNS